MSEPLSEERLAELEAQHARSDDERWDCRSDGDTYPCETMQLIAEVRHWREEWQGELALKVAKAREAEETARLASSPMTDERLAAIEADAKSIMVLARVFEEDCDARHKALPGGCCVTHRLPETDVPALIAEVRRLRA